MSFSSSGVDATCAENYRGALPILETVPENNLSVTDDDFFMFVNTAPCSLYQPVHYVLLCVELAFYAFAIIELILAQIRRNDKSPLYLQLSYCGWLVAMVVFSAYNVARHTAAVAISETDRAVLVVTFGLRQMIGIVFGWSATSTLVTSLFNMLHTTTNKNTRMAARLVNGVLLSVAVFFAATAALCMIILPNVVTFSASNHQTFLQVVWTAHSFTTIIFFASVAVVSWQLRKVVVQGTTFQMGAAAEHHSSESSSSREHRDRDSSKDQRDRGSSTHRQHMDPNTNYNSLKNVADRLIRSSYGTLVSGVVGTSLMMTAAILGMRFWYVRCNAFLSRL